MPSREEVLAGFGAALRRERAKADVSQEQLAEAADVHVTYVSQVERGLKNVTLYNICRFARALGTTPASLLRGLIDPA
jgi:transcriptional regulator with XRE-family HTH domain